MRILVVDDNRESQRRLKRGFDRKSKDFDIEFKTDIAVTVTEAQEQLSRRAYHGISFDQRLPESREGAVHSEHGMALLRGTSYERRMSFAAVYTNYPGGKHGHIAGKEQLDYIAKSSTNDGVTPEGYPRRTVPGYTRWFLDELVWEYPKRVIFQARDSALFDWGPEMDVLLEGLTKLRKMPADEEVTAFFQRMNYVRVEANNILHKIFSVLVARADKKNPHLPERADQLDVEKTLNIQWGLLKGTKFFPHLQAGLGMDEHESFSEYYIDHVERLRKIRNQHEHGGKVSFTPDDFRNNYSSIIRILDILRFLVSVRIIFQPQTFRSGLLSFKDMSVRGRSPATEIFYDHNLQSIESADSIYLQLSNHAEIIDASGILKCIRDPKDRPVLAFFV